uniref:DNA helicase n=1 Tax=Albugo laibachii Nc14 TaxID=890382 RepID=F0W7L1_9STRA|nr:DNA replication licensing factor MCM8 putative [Albugo laibachii Nc14]|eukprot:CCA17112.1 DNA replication licensing factor MCM8 putative [Albugo laibachii Nc14]
MFHACFTDAEQWGPLIEMHDLTEESIQLSHRQLINRCALCDFAGVLQQHPEQVIACLGLALCLLRDKKEATSTRILIRLCDVAPVLSISHIKSHVINQFVSVRGTVVRVSPIKPLVTQCNFICGKCGRINLRVFPDGKYNPPIRCIHGCRSKVLPDRSTVKAIDFQTIKLQEIDHEEHPGRVPRMIEVELHEDLVDSCIPGNVVTIGGFVKSVNAQVHSGKFGKQSQNNSLHILYLFANNVAHSNEKCEKDADFNNEDLQEISRVYNVGNVFERLVASMCPQIYRNELVKAGLLLALCGGTQNTHNSFNVRANSHVLLVGDPGLGKSQLLRASANIAPRSVYVGGNTATATGLTVSMSKDSSGGYALEAGALVLADEGVCCIDEFDKMGTDTQALLEAMEQQSISIAKAGIACNLNARASVVAAANPIGGHYDSSKLVHENLNMKAALLSRFDLVFILLDRPDEERDRLLSSHIMNTHASVPRGRKQLENTMEIDGSATLLERLILHGQVLRNYIPVRTIRKLITYSKRYLRPQLTREAAIELQAYYLELRGNSEFSLNGVSITVRQLESLVRLAQARARIELSNEVTVQHARDVIEIMACCLRDTDVSEGSVPSAVGLSLPKKIKFYAARLEQVAKREGKNVFSLDELMEIAKSARLEIGNFHDFLDVLNEHCIVLKKGPKRYQLQASSIR